MTEQHQQNPDEDHSTLTILTKRTDDYLLLAASILGLFAVFFYIYILTGERERFVDNEGEGEDINGDGVRTKRLTKEERKALKSSFSHKKPPKVRLDTGQLEKRMWYIPSFCTQEEVDELCRLILEKQAMHVADLSDELGITCWQTMAAIKEGEKNGKLRGYLTDEGIYRFTYETMDAHTTSMPSMTNTGKLLS